VAVQALVSKSEQLQNELLAKNEHIDVLSSEAELLKKEVIGREAQIGKLTVHADWLKKELAAKDELLAVEKNVVLTYIRTY